MSNTYTIKLVEKSKVKSIPSPETTNYEFTFTNRINYKFLELLGDKSNCGTQTSHRSVNIKAKPRALVSCQGISS